VEGAFRKYGSFIGSMIVLFWSGSLVFGYSGVISPYWKELLGVGSGEIGNLMFFLLFCVGAFMFVVGKLQEVVGFRIIVLIGIFLCSLGLIFVTNVTSIYTIYLWGVINGIQSSLVYIPTVTVVQMWFPRTRGLVSGALTMIFGLSAGIMSPIFLLMFQNFGYVGMNQILSVLILATGIPSSIIVSAPRIEEVEVDLPSMTVKDSVKTRNFWLLWLVWALQGAGGISMVTLSIQIGLSKKFAISSAVLLLTSFNIMNGLSRFISGLISDKYGRNLVMSLSFFSAGISYILLIFSFDPVVSAVLTAVIGYSFGTMFAVSAPLASDCFGLKHFGAIFGLIFTAYGFVAGIIGPSLSGYIMDITGNYAVSLLYLGFFCIVSSLLIMMVKPAMELKVYNSRSGS
jgi:OFA family oxalate/formate antiporter-like MFS transporter